MADCFCETVIAAIRPDGALVGGLAAHYGRWPDHPPTSAVADELSEGPGKERLLRPRKRPSKMRRIDERPVRVDYVQLPPVAADLLQSPVLRLDCYVGPQPCGREWRAIDISDSRSKGCWPSVG
jgi:hypothetical protein